MARNNRMSATFIMDSGDGASGFTEQYGEPGHLQVAIASKIDGTVNGNNNLYYR